MINVLLNVSKASEYHDPDTTETHICIWPHYSSLFLQVTRLSNITNTK